MKTEELFDYAAALCARSEQCRHSVAAKLRQRGADADEAERIIGRLEEEGFLDERRYARAFCHDHVLTQRWGPAKIAYALRRKGLNSRIISEALEETGEEQFRENLDALLRAKARTTRADNGFQLRQKLARFAISRGYEPDDVFAALDDSSYE